MDPEEGSLWVFGVGEHGVPAFTEYGIECLKQIIIEERALLKRKRASHPTRLSAQAAFMMARGLD